MAQEALEVVPRPPPSSVCMRPLLWTNSAVCLSASPILTDRASTWSRRIRANGME